MEKIKQYIVDVWNWSVKAVDYLASWVAAYPKTTLGIMVAEAIVIAKWL